MLARVAYHFRPPEYFALPLFGLSMLASISSGGAIKNLIGGVFGVWVASIGAELTTGTSASCLAITIFMKACPSFQFS